MKFMHFFFLCLVEFLLKGCGGVPLLSKEQKSKLQSVYVCNIPERYGQMLRQGLIHFFKAYKGSKHCPYLYDLKVVLEDDVSSMSFGTDARTNAAHLKTIAKYQVVRRCDQKVVIEGEESVDNSFNILASYNKPSFANVYYSTTKGKEFTKQVNIDLLKEKIAMALLRQL